MKNPLLTLAKILFALPSSAAVLVLATSPLAAQAPSVPSSDTGIRQTEGESILLSPFVTSASRDGSYAASTSLTGTRLNTNLADIASTVSVVTKEFMEDTAANSAEELFVYTTGTEIKGVGGNMALPSPGFRGVSEDNGSSNRIRGLAAADLTRNLFSSDIPFDGYNINRVEINRGANAALFGLGSPAGIINHSTNNAVFSNSGEVELRVDSNEGYRGSFDLNRVVIPDKLAIRVSGLSDRGRFEQEEAFRNDNRQYLAGTYSHEFAGKRGALGRTTIRSNYERISINENRPNVLPPVDGITTWFTGFEHALLTSVATKGTWRNNTDAEYFWAPPVTATPNARQQFWVVQGGSNRGPILTVPEPDALRPFAGTIGSTPIVGRQPVINDAVRMPNGRFATGILVAPTLLPEALNFSVPGVPEWTLYTSPTLRDTSVFDFRNHMLLGPNRPASSNFDAFNISLEQLFFRNKAGIEFAYDEQNAERQTFALIPSGITHRLYIDVNETVADGSPNPNFGRPFVAGQQSWSERTSKRSAERVTGFFTHDFAERSGGFWARLLGRHTFTGVYGRQQVDVTAIGGGVRVNADYIYGRNNNTTTADWETPIMVYLGPDISGRTTASGANISPIGRQYSVNNDFVGGGQFSFRGQAPGDVPQLSRVTFDDRWVGGGDKTRLEVDSTAVIWQGNLLDNHIVPTLSWRRDEADSIVTGAPRMSSRQSRLVYDPTWTPENYAQFSGGQRLLAADESTSFGVVAKLPMSWMKNVPLLDGLSVLYNESSNFQVVGGRRDVFGNSIAPPIGENKEYGIRLQLFDNKMSVNAVRYETTQANIGSGGGFSLGRLMSSLVRVIEPTVLGRNPDADGDFLPENAAGAEISLPQQLLDFTNFNISPTGTATFTLPVNYASVRDVVSEGTEIEVVYNPTNNWRIAMNVAQQKATISNVQAAEKRLWEQATITVGGTQKTIKDAWTNDFADLIANTNNIPAPAGALRKEFSDELTNTLAAGQSLNGQRSPELREWRVNLVTNYRFGAGRLSGFSVGGALRWEDEVAIGGPVIFLEDGTPVTDIKNPYFGPSELRTDVWLGYRTKILGDRIGWKVQLNIRNALDEDDLVPIISNPDGYVAVHRIPAGRTFILTSTFEF